MYMTRIMLRNVPQPNIIHGILSAAFPGKRNDQRNETLWRVDQLGDKRSLIIVSTKVPDRELISRKIGIANTEEIIGSYEDKTLDYGPFLGQIEANQTWHFRLSANPVKHIKVPGKRGKIWAYPTVGEQVKWLEKQGAKYGFNIKSCSVIGDEYKRFGNVIICVVTFDGLLAVSDTEAFCEALKHGIGRGKAYGCGLLTIARAEL